MSKQENENLAVLASEKGGGLTRRNLFTGAAALSAAAVAGSLLSCSSPSPQDGTMQNKEGASSGQSAVPSELNPQDESFTSATTDFSHLLSKTTIGDLELRNRIVKSAAGSYALDEEFDDQAVGFYREIAKGGSALVLVEGCAWISEDAASVEPVVTAIHEEGALAGIQVWGTWDRSASAKDSISPLEVASGGFAREKMDIDQIHDFQEEVLDMVDVYAEAGFDLVELNASCDHAFGSFLSRFLNVERDDEYGPQSFENRARILTELIASIKEKHPDMAVQILFNGIEENAEQLGDNDLCMKTEEAIEFAQIFEATGVDSLQIRSAIFGNHAAGFLPDIMHISSHGNTGLGGQVDYASHMEGIVDGSKEGVAALLDVAAAIKPHVSIPVGVVGNVDPRLAPDLVNGAIAEGKVDFIVINRPLLADPLLPNKLAEGKLEEIRPCTKCVSCFQSVANWEGIGYCRVNPAHIRAYTSEMPEGYDPAPATEIKKVLVVGGGPAGLEAATIAAQKGHTVSLFEKNSTLGGMMTFASAIKGPHERIADYLEYLSSQASLTGVSITTETLVDEAFINEQNPDVVIVATGGLYPDSAIPIEGSKEVISFSDLGTQQASGSVCIIGGDLRATDYATSLVIKGQKVTLVHTGTEEDLASAQAPWARAVALPWLKAKGVAIYNESSNIKINDNGVSITTPYGTNNTLFCDTVVLCEDLQPDMNLSKALDGSYEVYSVGDCSAPSNILDAVAQANIIARSI